MRDAFRRLQWLWGKERSLAVPGSSLTFSHYSRGPFLPWWGPHSELMVAAVAVVSPHCCGCRASHCPCALHP